MAEESKQEFQIQKIYIKDMSFEIPHGAKAFQSEWQPELDVDIQTQTNKLENDTHEVILTVKCTVKCSDQTAFIAEVEQAGVFTVTGLNEEQLGHALGAYAPNILYPYLREAISDMVMKGGFPQLSLAPVNFDMLYEQQKAEVTGTTTDTVH